MPVRKMTAEEAEQIFGRGFIVIGQKRPVAGKQGDVPPVAPTKALKEPKIAQMPNPDISKAEQK